MQPHRWLAVGSILVTASLVVWSRWPYDASPPPLTSTRVTDTASLQPPPVTMTPPNQREPVELQQPQRPADQAPALRIRLRGLRPDLPWSAPLRMQLSDRGRNRSNHPEHACEGALDDGGQCVLALPEWWRPDSELKLRIQARNDGYRELEHRHRGTIEPGIELILYVQPIASIAGRVTDFGLKPVRYARITAFVLQNGEPVDPFAGEASTGEDGRYVLQAPPDVPLLLIATPMWPNTMRWQRIDSVQDNGTLRDDLLPSARELLATVRAPLAGIDFVLSAAQTITGSVRFADGTAVANAQVRLEPAGGKRLQISSYTDLVWRPRQPATTAGSTGTDEFGRFSLGAEPGVAADLLVTHVGELRVHGAPPRQRVVAPQTVELTLPRPVTVRAVHDGALVQGAHIEIESEGSYHSHGDGMTRLLLYEDVKVRADRGPLRSPWRTITRQQEGQIVDLVMQ